MDELIGRDVDLDREVDLAALLAQDLVEGLGLGAVAGEAVEDDPLRGIALGESVQEHPDGDVVGDQLTPVHVAPRFQPDREPSRTAARNRSPVATRQPEVRRRGACVPLPEPGAPSSTMTLTLAPSTACRRYGEPKARAST